MNEELLVRALARPSPYPSRDWRHEEPPLDAAVCVPIAWQPEPTVFAVLRSSELRDHAGEVGFPGGKPEPSDRDLQATALRELEEEVGIREVRVLGAMTPVPVITGRYVIHPFVGVLDRERPSLHSSEIAKIFAIPILPYMRGEAEIHGVMAEWKGNPIITPHFKLGESILYGASAYILYELLLRVAAELSLALPRPTLVDDYPWGDRYRHGRGQPAR